MEEVARFSKRAVGYVDYWLDRPARNEDTSPMWCLGRSYESDYQPNRLASSSSALPGTSPSAQSDVSHADSAVVTKTSTKADERTTDNDDELVKSFDQVQLSKSMDEEDLGWPSEFVDDFESRVWITYRKDFPPIPKSTDSAAGSKMSLMTTFRSVVSREGFTSDTGWGCMIRSGQALLANTIILHRLGRDWRKGQKKEEHKHILSLFADTPEAPFSIHKFVEHGAQACGTYPGEWFGPNATARCLRALTDKYHEAGLRVYARPNDSDVYADAVIETATQKDADDKFQPTLIVLGIRLGIEKVTSAYHVALKAALEMPQSVGIAGGRTRQSHYFLGHQGDSFFYLDPHTTQPMLSPQPSAHDIETCHMRRIRKLALSEMDPSMLLGFLIHSKEEFGEWRKAVAEMPGKPIIHIHETEPKYATGNERAGAIDEVETMDETLDEDDDGEGEKI